ncbi:RNA recognition motif domain-containing protein [Neptunicella marina]|uniref:RNA-binding protein n=1 Tax=Neptunicella marina TaxID=2125989 RepID=A0A8J6IYB9_9ALTE|nr:RNA-binding protein [Neptunicella marina]MBC3767522.1 RNA-binding protein [Neptunicella marina]
MKSSFALTIITTLVLSIICYILVSVLAINLDAASAIAIGVILGALPSILMKNQNSVSAGAESNDDLQTLYVGNLPYRANEKAIAELFNDFGKVNSVRLMKDRRTGKRKGYGFVEIENGAAKKAIAALNDTEFQERTLKVRMAKDKAES